MATWADVEAAATALPEVEESTSWGNRAWKVRGKTFVWVRPLTKADRKVLGSAAPEGPIVGIRTSDIARKEFLVREHPDCVFTIPHFDGYAAVLALVDEIGPELLRELIGEAWECMAPAGTRRGR